MTHEGFPGSERSTVGGDFMPGPGHATPTGAEHMPPTALEVMDRLPEAEHFADLPNDAQIQLLRTDRFNYLHSQAGLPTLQEYVDSPDSHIPRTEFDSEFSGEISPRGFLLDREGNETSDMPWHLTQFDVDPDRMSEDAETAYQQFIAEQKMARAIDGAEDTEVSAIPITDDEPTDQIPLVVENVQPEIDPAANAKRLNAEHLLRHYQEVLESHSHTNLEERIIRNRIRDIEQELGQMGPSRQIEADRMLDQVLTNLETPPVTGITVRPETYYPDMGKRRQAVEDMITAFQEIRKPLKRRTAKYRAINDRIAELRQELALMPLPSQVVPQDRTVEKDQTTERPITVKLTETKTPEKVYYDAEISPLLIAWQGLRATVSERRAKRAESKLNRFNQRARVAEQAADVIEDQLDGNTETRVTRRHSGRKNKKVARNAELTSQVLEETPTELLSQVRAELQKDADKLRAHGKVGTKIRHYTNKHARLTKQASNRRRHQAELRTKTTPVDITGWASESPASQTAHEIAEQSPPIRPNRSAAWYASSDGIAPDQDPTIPTPIVTEEKAQTEQPDEVKEGSESSIPQTAQVTESRPEPTTPIEYTTLRQANEEALEKWRKTMSQYREGSLEYKLAEGAIHDLEVELAQMDKQDDEA